MIIVRKAGEGKEARLNQQRKANEHLKHEKQGNDPIFKTCRLTGKKTYYSRVL